MKISALLLGSACMLQAGARAQTDPVITSWVINTTNAVGYNNIPSSVQTVQYSASDVYVTCTCIPGYAIGPWRGNPNVASKDVNDSTHHSPILGYAFDGYPVYGAYGYASINSLKNLSLVLGHYSAASQQKDAEPLIRQTGPITEQEKTDLIAFLQTLTDRNFLYDRRFADPFMN